MTWLAGRLNMSLENWQSVAQIIAALGTLVAAIYALWIYRRNSRLERSRWASTLYEKFYETGHYKKMRELLDVPADADHINEIVIREEPDFTDYLNFFEYVAILTRSGQLRDENVRDLFGYYLDCLKRHERVRKYIGNPTNGYEKLDQFLRIGNE